MKKINVKQIAIFIVYGILIFLVFLYLRFPSDLFREYFINKISEEYPGTTVLIGDVAPRLPLGIVLKKFDFRYQNQSYSSIKADALFFNLNLLELLRGKTSYKLSATGYGGEIAGNVCCTPYLSEKGTKNADLKFENIDLQDFFLLHEVFNRPLTGKLKLKINYANAGKEWQDGTGSLDFTIQNGTYPLGENLAVITKLEFSKAEGAITMKAKSLKITKLQLTGEKIRLSLKGDIAINAANFKGSSLNLTGTLETRTPNSKTTAFTITGTFANPETKIENKI